MFAKEGWEWEEDEAPEGVMGFVEQLPEPPEDSSPAVLLDHRGNPFPPPLPPEKLPVGFALPPRLSS